MSWSFISCKKGATRPHRMKKKVDLPRRATTLDRSLSKLAQSPSKFLPVYNLVPSQLVHGSATCTRSTTKQSCYRRQAALPLVERMISVTALFLVLHKCGLWLIPCLKSYAQRKYFPLSKNRHSFFLI